jgi:hypothetical protein
MLLKGGNYVKINMENSINYISANFETYLAVVNFTTFFIRIIEKGGTKWVRR